MAQVNNTLYQIGNLFIDLDNFDPKELHVFAKIVGNREKICITYGPTMRSLAFISPEYTISSDTETEEEEDSELDSHMVINNVEYAIEVINLPMQ